MQFNVPSGTPSQLQLRRRTGLCASRSDDLYLPARHDTVLAGGDGSLESSSADLDSTLKDGRRRQAPRYGNQGKGDED